MKTGNQTISFEIKSQLAKLLATENISMRHEPNSKTAYFDVKKRELILPVWQNISEDLYDMLVVHEVGHALDTPMDKWMDAIDSISKQHHESPTDKNKNAIKGFLNVIEDARIDKRQKRRYPGSRRNYVIGYKELHERDFFGISKRDVNTMTFIDRINIFFKNGAIFNIKFSADERAFIKRIENAETFEDVVTITSDIYKFSIDNRDFKKTPVNNDSSEEEMDIEIEVSTSDVDADMEDFEEIENDDIEDTGAPSSITDDDEDEDEKNDVNTNSTQGGSTETEPNDIETPETELAAENAVKSIIVDDEYRYIYLDTPEFNHANIVDDYTVVIPQMKKARQSLISYGYPLNDINKSLIKFKKAEQDTISFMIKEFEMRKAADTYARVSVSKTGVIDTNKIYSYKYNDDIFKRLSIVPTGKNHGFVMFLDWSGSMLTDLKSTMKQLFSLVMFCKRVQIPFEVYTFRNSIYDERKLGKSMFKDNAKVNLKFDSFKLRNILSSRMNLQTLNEAFEVLWFVAHTNRNKYECDPLDSTPLNQTILAADYVINKFKKETKVQIVNTIFLTDGASDPIGINYTNANCQFSGKIKGDKIFVRDHITKKNYYVSSMYSYSATETFLKMLKERTGCNLIGFYITRNFNMAASLLNIEYTSRDSFRKKFRDDNYVGITSAGYDEYYIMNIHKASEDTDLNVTPDMTKKAVLKEFMKFSEKKTTNRVMLSKFMQRVAA